MTVPAPIPVPDDQYQEPGPLGFADQVIEDVVTLRDDGHLPSVLGTLIDQRDSSPGTLAWQMLCAYLTSQNLHGYAAQHLAERGIEHRCPSWCISDHDRFQIKLPGNRILHDAWLWTDPDSAATVTVTAETREEDGVLSWLEIDVLNCEALNGEHARRLAEAIVSATEVYDRLSAD